MPTSDALEIQRILTSAGVDVPRLVPAQQQQLTFAPTPDGPSPQIDVRTRGWQMATSDNTLVVTVQPGSLSVQSTRYVRWSASIAPALDAALGAVETVGKPELVQRVGIRFVNRLVDDRATTPQAWTGRISPSAMGPLTDETFAATIVGTQQQLELQLGDTEGALIRHGAFVDASARGAYSYIIDIDAFDSAAGPFVGPAILARATTLNRTVLSIFQQMTTAEYRATLQPYATLDERGEVTTYLTESGAEAP